MKPVHRPGAFRPSRGLSKRPCAAPTAHPGAASGVSGGTLARPSSSEVAGGSEKPFDPLFCFIIPSFEKKYRQGRGRGCLEKR